MRNWHTIEERSTSVSNLVTEHYLDVSDTSTTDSIVQKVTERLFVPTYFREKLIEQSYFDPETAFARFHAHTQRQKHIRLTRRILSLSGIAAILVIALVGFVKLSQKSVSLPTTTLHAAEQIVPGSKKALLILSDGRIVNLGDSSTYIETNAGTLRVESSEIVCDNANSTQATETYNTLSIPRGGEYNLRLSDGTRVWLNSESELRFPITFGGGNRTVYLQGEAYFEVQHDDKKPFIVTTGGGNIRVYGTSFNLTYYTNEGITATLEQGRIGFSRENTPEVLLRPGYQLTCKTTSAEPVIKKVDPDIYTSWHHNIFRFDNQPLGEIMKTLARWYDLDVEFTSENLKQLRLSGTLDRYSEIHPLLTLFEAGVPVKFEIVQRKITIYPAKP